jgi:hypothetical protein
MLLSSGKDCHCEEPEATKQSLFLQEIASLLPVARNDTVAELNAIALQAGWI